MVYLTLHDDSMPGTLKNMALRVDFGENVKLPKRKKALEDAFSELVNDWNDFKLNPKLAEDFYGD